MSMELDKEVCPLIKDYLESIDFKEVEITEIELDEVENMCIVDFWYYKEKKKKGIAEYYVSIVHLIAFLYNKINQQNYESPRTQIKKDLYYVKKKTVKLKISDIDNFRQFLQNDINANPSVRLLNVTRQLEDYLKDRVNYQLRVEFIQKKDFYKIRGAGSRSWQEFVEIRKKYLKL